MYFACENHVIFEGGATMHLGLGKLSDFAFTRKISLCLGKLSEIRKIASDFEPWRASLSFAFHFA